VEFIEARAFTKLLANYMDDDEYRVFQAFLVHSPTAGDVVQGTGGFRKIWTDNRRSKGKRGGLRVIYYFVDGDALIWLLTVYGKDEADDLTPEQKRQLREAITQEKAERERRGRKKRQ
jgi:mRNA-degrading endonuclease RelE of RelBE toxin-antitoxin system